jgi:hypothetical protein
LLRILGPFAEPRISQIGRYNWPYGGEDRPHRRLVIVGHALAIEPRPVIEQRNNALFDGHPKTTTLGWHAAPAECRR